LNVCKHRDSEWRGGGTGMLAASSYDCPHSGLEGCDTLLQTRCESAIYPAGAIIAAGAGDSCTAERSLQLERGTLRVVCFPEQVSRSLWLFTLSPL
jgi:hypothetical protein